MQKSPEYRTFSHFLMRGEIVSFNYLAYTIKLKCEQSVFKLFKKNKLNINLFESV